MRFSREKAIGVMLGLQAVTKGKDNIGFYLEFSRPELETRN